MASLKSNLNMIESKPAGQGFPGGGPYNIGGAVAGGPGGPGGPGAPGSPTAPWEP